VFRFRGQSLIRLRLAFQFGVFDGHGGVQSADYAVKHLPNNVIRCFQKHASSGRKDGTLDTKRILGALEDAFPLTDAELLNFARRKGFRDGTTALFMLITGTELDSLMLFCAHVGDCRAVLCRGGDAIRLTHDHRPDRKDEQKRIKDAGGGVFQVADKRRVQLYRDRTGFKNKPMCAGLWHLEVYICCRRCTSNRCTHGFQGVRLAFVSLMLSVVW